MITELCESLGFLVWLPHRDTRSYLIGKYPNPEERTKNLYNTDTEKVKSSKLIIAELTNPSYGVGEELRVGDENDIDIIAIAKEDANVSATVVGNPAIKKFIRYEDVNGLEKRLRRELERYAKDKDYLKANYDFHDIFKEWATPKQIEAYSWIFK